MALLKGNVRVRRFGSSLWTTCLTAAPLACLLASIQAAHAQATSQVASQTNSQTSAPAQGSPDADTAANTAVEGPILQDVIVTATKRPELVDTVPLSITAVTQAAIQQQDLRSVQDIARTVPGLDITDPNSPGGESIAIRGISSAVSSSPTTAVYLDDIPLQTITLTGAASGGGTPLPQLYDLDRVEVLRGPQGTLYGQGAEGGAVRFITPTPSLNNYSGTARAEVSDTYDGGTNYEGGAAYGAPIVPGVLAFRASLWGRSDSGYIDHVYAYTGQTLGNDTNSEDRWQGRFSMLYTPTDALQITTAFYIAYDHFADSDTYTENVPQFTVAATASGNPAHTFGPYSYGPYKSIVNCNIGENFIDEIAPCYVPSPRTNTLNIPSLSIEYDLGALTLHSATGFITADGSGFSYDGFGDTGGVNGGVPLLYNFPEFNSGLTYNDLDSTFSEELRANSKPNTGPWTWIGGIFVSRQHLHSFSADYAQSASAYNAMIEYTRNETPLAAYGAPINSAGVITLRNQSVTETEYAAFGEADYAITHHLTGIVGLRLSNDKIDYNSYLQGPFFGYNVPTAANGGLTAGSQSASALLPKFSAEYQFTETKLLYATASKGERNGGVNTAPYTTKCASTFAEDGITGTPLTFNPDTLWDYDLGGKFRTLAGRAQINADVFYINWNDVQTTYSLPSPCGFSYTSNAGGAVSRGAELQTQWQLTDSLLASLNYAYTEAYYTSAVTGPAPTFKPFVLKGSTLPVPPVGVDAVLQYQPPIWREYSPFVSVDYQYSSPYKRNFGPGTSGYNVDTYVASETRYATLRLGAIFENVQVALFADNLFNSQDVLTRSGGRSCGNASCSVVSSYDPIFTDSSFRPRTIGVTGNYKF